MSRALNRHYAHTHMMRRLKEDRAQHSSHKTRPWNQPNICPCEFDPKAMARFKEQPQICSCYMCGNRRHIDGPTMQERRVYEKIMA